MSDDKSVEKIVHKALGRIVPSTNSPTSMTTPPLSPTILFRPNNYRLGVKFSGLPLSGLGTRAVHSGLIFWRKGNITVQVGTRLVVGIWNQGKDRQTWRVGRDSLSALEGRLDEIKGEIEGKIRDVVQEYAEASGIVLDGDFFWVRHEDWVKGEEYIDKIPKEFTIHDTVFKKVYNESAIEFIGGRDKPATVEIKQYIKNRVVEDFAPEIVRELSSLREEFVGALREFKDDALMPLTAQLKLHLAVEAQQKDNMDLMNANLLKQNDVLSSIDARLGVGESPLNRPCSSESVFSFPQHSEIVGGEGFSLTPNVSSLPSTMSRFDVESKSKKYRLWMARKFLDMYGWSSNNWGGV